MLTGIDKSATILSKLEGAHTFALPPVSLVLRPFALLTLFVFSLAQKFVLFCDCRVVPIRFCASPRRPCRKILICMGFFHGRNIGTDSARNFIVGCAVDKGQRSIHFFIIPLTPLLPLSFLLLALPLCLLTGQACLLVLALPAPPHHRWRASYLPNGLPEHRIGNPEMFLCH